MQSRFAMILGGLILCACNAGGAGPVRAPGSDAQLQLEMSDPPPGCPPGGKGNDRGIGAACTRNGHECANGLSCLCDDRLGMAMPSKMPCFCTDPALGTCAAVNPACGANAMCCEFPVTDTQMISGCFPMVCLWNAKCPVVTLFRPDAGADTKRD
jgi:hypothetical protein